MNEYDIAQALDRIWERSNVRTIIYGRLGQINGTVEEIEVRGRPGYVYVSVGDQGDQGVSIAKDRVGVARVVFQQVRMRRELGELVIFEAASYLAASEGGEEGVNSFFELEEVDPTGWDNGEVPTWDVATGTFKPMLPGEGGEGGGTYLPGHGITFRGNIIDAHAHPIRGIIVDENGIGVLASATGGLEADLGNGELRIKRHDTISGLVIDANGVRVGEGSGIDVLGSAISVDVTEIHDPDKGLDHTGNLLEVKLSAPHSGLLFGTDGGVKVGAGDGIQISGTITSVKRSATSPAGMTFGTDDGLMITEYPGIKVNPLGLGVRLPVGGNSGLYFLEDPSEAGHYGLAVGEGDGINILPNGVEVKLSSVMPSGLDFEASGGLFVGEGDGIDVTAGAVAVDVVEIINTQYGIDHDGANNIIVALEFNSGLRYNNPSGKLELGEPGNLDVFSVSELIDDTHYHHVATSSNPGSARAIMATDLYGGFIFDTNLLIVDAANDRIGINTVPENGVGAAALDVVVDNLDDITQRLRQKQDQRGRIWRVENYLGQELIVLDPVGNLQSGNPGFVSSMTGWQISHTGNAEFNNIWARGELHATVFVKDEIHATGGTFMVASAATFWEDAVITDTGVGEIELYVDNDVFGAGVSLPLEVVTTSASFEGTTLKALSSGNIIRLNHPPSGPATYFQPGEILRVKTEINEEGNPLRLSDLWFVVNQGDASHEEYGEYSVTKKSGSNCTIPAGTAIVTYGLPGDGAILMTSDWRPASNDDGYAPYIDVFTTGEEPWTGLAGAITPHIRLGQLKGVGLPGVSGINRFGMVAGTDLSDASSAYLIASGDGVEMYRGKIRLHNGANLTGLWDEDGNFRLGKNVSQDATTGFRVITTSGHADEGDVYIGDPSGTHYLHWNQAAGTLLVSGSLQVGGGEGFATTTYVDEQMDDAVIESNAYTNSQIALIGSEYEGYTDSRRMIAVDGTWTSVSYNKIRWASVKAYFANQTTRTITNSIAGDFTVNAGRTFLYVDLDTVGNLTLLATQSATSLIQPSFVVIAVVDRGNGTSANDRPAINIVIGSTYISGANIITGSILASNIAANAIDTGWLAAGAVTAEKIDVGTLSTINGTKVKHIEGILVPAANTVSWGGAGNNLRVTLANNVLITVLAGSRVITGREYAYILNSTVNVTNFTLRWYDPNESGINTLPADAIVVAVCEQGTNAASAIMVTGGVVISGDDIVAQSITSAQIKAGSITAESIQGKTITSAQLADSVTDDIVAEVETGVTDVVKSDLAHITIMGMNAKLTSDPNLVGHITWPALTMRFQDGRLMTLDAGEYQFTTETPTARIYFHFDPLGAGTTLLPSLLVPIPTGNIILAMAERGTIASSVTMLYGGVVISGNSIVAGSITAAEIAARTITAEKIAATTITTAELAPSVLTNFESSVLGKVADQRILAVDGQIVPSATESNRVDWPIITYTVADGTRKTIPAGGVYLASNVKTYFYVPQGAASGTAFLRVTDVDDLPPNAYLIAVCYRGAVRSTAIMVNGGVYISGDDIVADSIHGNKIVASTIHGDKITANTLNGDRIIANTLNANAIIATNLSAITATTGNLTVNGTLSVGVAGSPDIAGNIVVGKTGKIYSAGKTTYGSSVAGWFLGWDSTAYKFSIGTSSNYMKWDGSDFEMRFMDPITLIPTAANNTVFYIQDSGGTNVVTVGTQWNLDGKDWLSVSNLMTTFLDAFEARADTFVYKWSPSYPAMKFDAGSYVDTFGYDGADHQLTFSGNLVAAGAMFATTFINNGNTLRIVGSHTPSAGSGGAVGSICWDGQFIYVCTAANTWRKAQLVPV